jgi:hypothetical protein
LSAKHGPSADVPIGALRYRGGGASGRSASGTTSIAIGK